MEGVIYFLTLSWRFKSSIFTNNASGLNLTCIYFCFVLLWFGFNGKLKNINIICNNDQNNLIFIILMKIKLLIPSPSFMSICIHKTHKEDIGTSNSELRKMKNEA